MKLFEENAHVVEEVDSQRGMTALHIVCQQIVRNFAETTHHRYWRLLKFLLQSTKINVDAQDSKKWTALHHLLTNRLHTDWLEGEIDLLLQRRPDLSLPDNWGRCAVSAKDFPFFHKFFTYDDEQKRYVMKPKEINE